MSRLKGIIQSEGIRAVFGKDGEADWVLLVNGCPRACLEEEHSTGCKSVLGAFLWKGATWIIDQCPKMNCRRLCGKQ